MDRNKLIAIVVIASIFLSSRYISMRVEVETDENRFISQNYSSEWRMYFEEFNELVDLLDEENMENATDNEIVSGVNKFDREFFEINRRISNYEYINSNFDVDIWDLEWLIDKRLTNNLNISDYDIETIKLIQKLNVKYRIISDSSLYKTNRRRYIQMELPKEVREYEEELDTILEERFR